MTSLRIETWCIKRPGLLTTLSSQTPPGYLQRDADYHVSREAKENNKSPFLKAVISRQLSTLTIAPECIQQETAGRREIQRAVNVLTHPLLSPSTRRKTFHSNVDAPRDELLFLSALCPWDPMYLLRHFVCPIRQEALVVRVFIMRLDTCKSVFTAGRQSTDGERVWV